MIAVVIIEIGYSVAPTQAASQHRALVGSRIEDLLKIDSLAMIISNFLNFSLL